MTWLPARASVISLSWVFDCFALVMWLPHLCSASNVCSSLYDSIRVKYTTPPTLGFRCTLRPISVDVCFECIPVEGVRDIEKELTNRDIHILFLAELLMESFYPVSDSFYLFLQKKLN